ncbi:MAG TPA: hypothetical protein VF043_33395, partial [Ktedonobacteraceae bacterium]
TPSGALQFCLIPCPQTTGNRLRPAFDWLACTGGESINRWDTGPPIECEKEACRARKSHAGALRSQQQWEENNMNTIVIRQAVVVSILGALLCVALLLGVLLMLASIAGTHPSQTGIMLIASPSHLA